MLKAREAISSRTSLNRKRIGTNNFIISNLQTITPNSNQTMIKKLTLARRFIAAGVLSAFMFIGIASVNAQLTDGLVAHWPLDELNGDTTPDVVSGYDMTPTT